MKRSIVEFEFLEPSFIEFQSPLEHCGQFETVGDGDHHRLLLFVKLQQQLGDRGGGCPIKVAGRFVGQ